MGAAPAAALADGSLSRAGAARGGGGARGGPGGGGGLGEVSTLARELLISATAGEGGESLLSGA